MTDIDVREAGEHLSDLLDKLESGAETEVVSSREGKPAAKLVAVREAVRKPRRLGVAWDGTPAMTLEEFDADNAEIAALFNNPTL